MMILEPLRVSCPRCKKLVEFSANNPWRPFCSERCKLIDLGQWAEENYRVPSEDSASDLTVKEEPEKENSEDQT
ncbi:MAG: DNA gyrase inhibitor YacG [Bdellovibrio sp.]|nr:MAG: DNA gyrase inhibitor YacG [Bdellovibrio sp.]